MRLYTVRTGIVKTGEDIVEVIMGSLKRQNLQLEDGDVLALASKIVSYAEGRLARLSDVEPSEKAKELAKKFLLQPEFTELVLREADKVYGGVERTILTLKNGVLTSNAGIDNKNAPVDFVVLWPKNAKEWARHIREEIIRGTSKQIAVLIVDSGLAPLRLGTNGLALAVAGFKPIMDLRGEKDIFGKPLIITQHAVANDLASAAHLLMGEAAEKTPVVLIKDAPVVLDEGAYDSTNMIIPTSQCIFMNALRYS